MKDRIMKGLAIFCLALLISGFWFDDIKRFFESDELVDQQTAQVIPIDQVKNPVLRAGMRAMMENEEDFIDSIKALGWSDDDIHLMSITAPEDGSWSEEVDIYQEVLKRWTNDGGVKSGPKLFVKPVKPGSIRIMNKGVEVPIPEIAGQAIDLGPYPLIRIKKGDQAEWLLVLCNGEPAPINRR